MKVFTPENSWRASRATSASAMCAIPQRAAVPGRMRQPLVLNYIKGTLGLAHNGNLINAPELRRELEYSGAIFQTTIDSEVIAYHIAKSVSPARRRRKRCPEPGEDERRLFPGPLCPPESSWARGTPTDSSPCASASGTTPMVAGFRDLCPGDDRVHSLSGTWSLVRGSPPLPDGGIPVRQAACALTGTPPKQARCVFEYIYFARPDSDHGRRQCVPHPDSWRARYLAMDSPVDADLVVGVPESGNAAALGYSMAVRHPLRHRLCEEQPMWAEPSSSPSRAAGNRQCPM